MARVLAQPLGRWWSRKVPHLTGVPVLTRHVVGRETPGQEDFLDKRLSFPQSRTSVNVTKTLSSVACVACTKSLLLCTSLGAPCRLLLADRNEEARASSAFPGEASDRRTTKLIMAISRTILRPMSCKSINHRQAFISKSIIMT